MTRRQFGLLLALGTAVLVVWTLVVGRTSGLLGGDARYYHGTALELLRHGHYAQDGVGIWSGATIWRPPGYSLWLAAIYAIAGPQLLAVRLAQVVIHGCTAGLLAVAARQVTGNRVAAVFAGVAYLGYLPAILTTQQHASEAVSVFLAVALFCASFQTRKTPGVGTGVSAGVLAGIGALTRPQSALLLLLPIGLLACTAIKSRESRLALIGCALAFALTIAPWLTYTAQLAGRPSLGLSGCAEWISAEHYTGRFSYRWAAEDWSDLKHEWTERIKRGRALADPRSPIPPSVQAELYADRTWNAEARAIMRSTSPLKIVRDFPHRILALWGPAIPGIIGKAQWGIYALLAALGAYRLRKSWRAQWPIWLPSVLLCLAHVLLVVEPRYTFPLRPLLLIYAGVGAALFLTAKPAPSGTTAPT